MQLDAGGEEVAAMATTKEQLDQLTKSGPELDDRELMGLEVAWVVTPQAPPQPAAGTGQLAAAAARTPLAGRLLEPITPRWAVIGPATRALAHEPPRSANPDNCVMPTKQS